MKIPISIRLKLKEIWIKFAVKMLLSDNFNMKFQKSFGSKQKKTMIILSA